MKFKKTLDTLLYFSLLAVREKVQKKQICVYKGICFAVIDECELQFYGDGVSCLYEANQHQVFFCEIIYFNWETKKQVIKWTWTGIGDALQSRLTELLLLFPESNGTINKEYPLCTKYEYNTDSADDSIWKGHSGALRRRAIDFCIDELEDELGVAE